MNTKLLLKVKAAILAEPLKFDMDSYAAADENSPCGTTACIAGHVFAISKRFQSLKPVLEIELSDCMGRTIAKGATEKLQLDNHESARLFYVGRWPWKFEDAYRQAKTAKGRAKVAARRIDHFIKTKGAE